MRLTRRTERGFTLLELIVYIAVFSVVSALFVGILFYTILGWRRSEVESEVQQNVRFVMEDIARSVQSANSVTSPALGVSGNSLSLNTPAGTVLYSLSGTTLQKQVNTNPAEPLTTDKVSVIYLDVTTIQNSASSNNAVQATSTRFSVGITFNSANSQFAFTQYATSTVTLK